ncbi:hypothetical protein [Serratia marcescens]|uniref:hypothetical protein n=1 Tax=Serratia marcescens TaxID=615 RepID=UPI0007607BAE|nr:hypothetical protein [Serratia marcescens]
MTQTLTTTEELKHLASSDNANELTRRLARECLANREAQPVSVEAITEVMEQEWNEWCDDTGNFPDDFEWKGGNGILSYEPGKWSRRVAKMIINLTAPPAPAPAVQSVVDWRLDESTGAKILMYKDCSVIEDQQAEYVLSLIQAAAPEGGNG